MDRKGTMSDWIIAFEQQGRRGLAEAFHSSKLDDYDRLRKSGLPVLHDFQIPLNRFTKSNKGLMQHLDRFPANTIRVVPSTANLPRRFKIETRSFAECVEFLRESVVEGREDEYTVLMTEYVANEFAGIITSGEKATLIEIAPGSLADLSQGKSLVSGGLFCFHGQNHFKSMRYYHAGEIERGMMWHALQHIRRDQPSDSQFPAISFAKGYFEFITLLGSREVRFLDYKTNPAYLKGF